MSELNENNQSNNQNTNPDNGGPYYNPYPNYDPQPDGNNGQYYNPQPGYNNGQYYNPQPGYNNGQYYNPQSGYNNGQYYNPYPYPNPQTAYQQAQPVQQPVSNVFYYILMALTIISATLTIIVTMSLIRTVIDKSLFESLGDGQSYASLYSYLMDAFANSPSFSIYSMLSSVLGMAIFAVSIVDIVLVHKKGYPILGMVLFTILFKPGYFIWRAYVTKQRKVIPVLFTVFYALLYVGYFFRCMSYLISLV